MSDCPTCDGAGWFADHTEECYEAGGCIGCGGVQVLCDDPRGHADPCTHCDGNGQVWDPTVFGNVASCLHCTGGWVWRPAENIGDAGAHDVTSDEVAQ